MQRLPCVPTDPSPPSPVDAGTDPLEEEKREELLWMPIEGLSEQEEVISESVCSCGGGGGGRSGAFIQWSDSCTNHTMAAVGTRMVLVLVGGAVQV